MRQEKGEGGHDRTAWLIERKSLYEEKRREEFSAPFFLQRNRIASASLLGQYVEKTIDSRVNSKTICSVLLRFSGKADDADLFGSRKKSIRRTACALYSV